MDEQQTAAVDGQAATHERSPFRRRLGRGLDALLGGGHQESHEPQEALAPSGAGLTEIDVNLISRNPYQPRKDFDEEGLQELVASVHQHGVLQPLLVRPSEDGFQLIAGERRWLAAARAGLATVPCIVREYADPQMCEAAIEENLKRKDLHVLEKARAFQDYLKRFERTVEDLAKQLSMNRSTISNYLRLLELSEPVKEALSSERITGGHARALLSLGEAEQIALCERIQSESLSVRETEQAVRDLQKREPEGSEASDSKSGPAEEEVDTLPLPENREQPVSNHILSLQEQLRDALGAKVEIRVRGKEAGKIVITFQSNDEFERIVRYLRNAA